MLKEASYYLSDYNRYESILIEISHHISINDDQLNIYSEELADFIVKVGASVESLSKYLHSYLTDCFNNQKFPIIKRPDNFREFKRNESFETEALPALEAVWQLSYKEIMINSPLIHLTEKTKLLIPFSFLDQGNQKNNNANCFKNYQFIKHNRIESLRENAQEQVLAKNYYQIYSNVHTILVGLLYSTKKSQLIVQHLEKNISNIEKLVSITKNRKNKIEANLYDISKSEELLNSLNTSVLIDAVKNTQELLETTSSSSSSSSSPSSSSSSSSEEITLSNTNIKPTVKLAFEMLGALFILCIYVKHLDPKHLVQAPRVQHVAFYNDMDSVRYSKLFEAKVIDIHLTSFISSKDNLFVQYYDKRTLTKPLLESDIPRALFLVYDSYEFIISMYRFEQDLFEQTVSILEQYKQINKNFAQCVEKQDFGLSDIIEQGVNLEQFLNKLIYSFCKEYPTESESYYILELKKILKQEENLYQKYKTDLRDSLTKRLDGTASSIILNTFTTTSDRVYSFLTTIE